MENNILGKLIESALEERGISLRCMSRDTGLGLATCSRLVHGQGEPRTRTVIIACTYLGILLNRDMIRGYVSEKELSALRMSAKERLDFMAVKTGSRYLIETK